MPVLKPPKALVRANGIPEPLSSKVTEGCSIPRADVPTCNDLSLVACLLSRSLSRDHPQTEVFIPHGKQTQRTEAVRGSPPRESRGIEELWPLALGPDVSWCSGTPGRSPICQPGVLGTLHPGCLRGVVSACVSVEGFPCPYSPGPCPPGATGVAFRTRGSPSVLGGRAWRRRLLPAGVCATVVECEHPQPACLLQVWVSCQTSFSAGKACNWCLSPRNTRSWEVLGFRLTYMSFPILWSIFSSISYKYCMGFFFY